MFRHPYLRIALLLCVANASVSGFADAEDAITIEGLVVVLIDEADVPAAKDGIIASMPAREGKAVKTDELIARLDNRKALFQHAAAATELESAEHKLANQYGVELAEKKLSQQEQLKQQHQIELEMASAKAKNEVRVRASRKAEAVAKTELERLLFSRQSFVESVSQSDVDKQRLAHERTVLETEQAIFEQKLDAFQLRAKQEAADTIELGVQLSKIERDAAIADVRVAQLDVELSRQQLELSKLTLQDHEVRAPWNGVIAKRYKNEGEWVKQGEPIVRLIRLDRLRAEGFASPETASYLDKHASVEVTVETGNGKIIRRVAEIVFVSPELDPVNQERAFWIEFANPDQDVLPGMRLSVTIGK